MSVRYFFPPNRLHEVLGSTTRTADQCLEEAEANLRELQPQCLEHVEQQLQTLEKLLAASPGQFDDDFLGSVYAAALRLIGVASIAGLPQLDRATSSLCDVVDGMRSRGIWSREPIAVHVSSMRLLSQPNSAGADAIIEGLLGVRRKFAAEQTAPPPLKH